MLGRVAAVVIAFITTTPALPQCNFTPARSAQFRSSALDLAIDGNDIWVATSYGVSLYDRSADPPRLIASVAVPGITRVVRALNGIAYAGSGSSLVVIQKSGAHSLRVANTIDAGATITDIAAVGFDLYVATQNGVSQYDLLTATNPSKTSLTFPTSRTAANSVALINSFLYVADGDPTIEVFDVSIPTLAQRAGTVTAPAAVNFVRAANGKLYVSSGAIVTYVFVGSGSSMTNVGSGAFGTSSVVSASGDVVFMAAADRRLHAVDFTTTGAPIELFREDLPPTNGTANRIGALGIANHRLYVAAGDIGLVTYDVTNFGTPFPIHAYSTGGAGSIVPLITNAYAGRNSGGIIEFGQSPTGALTQKRSWDGGRADTVWDGDENAGFLLSSEGKSLTTWTLRSTTPQVVASATFRSPVVAAVLSGLTGYAVLADRTLWSANFADQVPAPRQLLNGVSASAIARSGSAIVVEQLNDDGTTALSYFGTGDLTQTPKSATVPGIAVTGVTLSGSTAAVLTFQGITLVDFASGATTVLPQSTGLARAIVLDGASLYQLTNTSLIVWDTQSRAVVKRYTIPADPVAMNVTPGSPVVDIATSSGVATIATNTTRGLPASIATANANAYYKRIAAASGRIDLFDGQNADIYSSILRFIASLRGISDFAANDRGVYTVSNGLTINSYTVNGVLRGSAAINAADARVLAIRAVGEAVWVSVEAGCPACTETTYGFDPRSGMSQTSSFDGGVSDLVTNGARAYVLTHLPSELRVVNIADPFHPLTVVSSAAPQSAVSVAYANGTVYVLGDKLTAFAEPTLTATAEILGSYVPDPAGVVTAADQRVRIDGNCAVVVGRSFAPQLFSIADATTWVAAPSFATPSPARAIATEPGILHVLTDHSLETWSVQPLPKAPRREAAR